MKRITTATVAAATALTLAVSPAHAQETTDDPADDNVIVEVEKEETVETPDGTKKTTNTKTTTKPADQGSSASSQGHVVAAVAGTLGAVLTTSLIVLSDPRGINKIIDGLNRNFGLGLPHVHVPQVQLPNLPF